MEKEKQTFTKQDLESPAGFEGFNPRETIALYHVIDVIRKQYELAGYVPLETSIVEREKILSAKAEGVIKNQMYGLRLLNPSPDAPTDEKKLALRFDQTVPLARFVAANHGDLVFPFRRYAIGQVVRGERPSRNKNRSRQFIQADIDVVGDGSLSLIHDAEPVSVVYRIFSSLNIGPFTTRVGNRKILAGLFSSFGIAEDDIKKAIDAVDDIDKQGHDAIVIRLGDMGIGADKARELIEILTAVRTTDELLAYLKQRKVNDLFAEGVGELEIVVDGIRKLGVPEPNFLADISVARGLDYYTSTVYETRLDEHPDIGSIASGGRFDKLTGIFINREFPGVGISIGVTRLVKRLMDAGLLVAKKATIADVLITTAAGIDQYAQEYLGQAKDLRDAEIPTEIYLEDRKLSKQMQHADRRGFVIVIIATLERLQEGTVVVRDMRSGKELVVQRNALVETVQNLLPR